MATTLTISHSIYLTREQRYAWFNGENLEIVGVSVPVWSFKDITSEPAVEIFAKYKLINKQDRIYIQQNDEGYEVTIPQNPLEEYKPLPDDVWNSLSKEEQNIWYMSNEPYPSIFNILDIKDGGSEWLAFRQYSKVKNSKKLLHLIHYVEIKPIEDLLRSIV
jgi:hypothetical protein